MKTRMLSVSFVTKKADVPNTIKKMDDVDVIQPAPFLSHLKRKVSLDLSLVEPKHVRPRTTKDDSGGRDDCVDDGDTIIIDIEPEPIFRPMKEVRKRSTWNSNI